MAETKHDPATEVALALLLCAVGMPAVMLVFGAGVYLFKALT